MFVRNCLALLAGALLASTAQADRLLIAGSGGFVLQADTDVGEFQYFACACAGEIISLAADDDYLYSGDVLGQLLVYDVQDGSLLNVHALGFGPLTAIATGDGDVFVGTQDGLILRIEPTTGVVLGARSVPAEVSALTQHRGMLYAASEGAIYSAAIDAPEFTYFTCFCFFQIQDLAVIDSTLVVGDATGTLGHVSLATGEVLNAFWVGTMNALVAQDGDVLVHNGNGAIGRFALENGQPLAHDYKSSIDIEVMLVINGDVPSSLRGVHPPD